MKFLKKRKDKRVKKLKTKVIELEKENNDLRVRIFHYKLKNGEVKLPQKRPMMKVMGNHGTTSTGAE